MMENSRHIDGNFVVPNVGRPIAIGLTPEVCFICAPLYLAVAMKPSSAHIQGLWTESFWWQSMQQIWLT